MPLGKNSILLGCGFPQRKHALLIWLLCVLKYSHKYLVLTLFNIMKNKTFHTIETYETLPGHK